MPPWINWEAAVQAAQALAQDSGQQAQVKLLARLSRTLDRILRGGEIGPVFR